MSAPNAIDVHDYTVQVEFETVRSGQVTLRIRSSEDTLTQQQLQALFENLESESEFAEVLEGGNGPVETSAPVCRIKSFEKLDMSQVKRIGSVDMDLDDYDVPEVE